MTTATTFPASPKAHILVVDDEDRVREGLSWSLRMSGYQVDDAASGAQALSLLGRGAFDLMLLDMNMPAMDGVEVMARRTPPTAGSGHRRAHRPCYLGECDCRGQVGRQRLSAQAGEHPEPQAAVAKALTARADLLRQQQVVALVGQVAEILQPSGAGDAGDRARCGTRAWY